MDHISYTKEVLHIVYPLLDAKSENISKFFNEFFFLVEQKIRIGNIFVHCAAGISRVTLPYN
jgi:protein-tyrosine phosphatase